MNKPENGGGNRTGAEREPALAMQTSDMSHACSVVSVRGSCPNRAETNRLKGALWQISRGF